MPKAETRLPMPKLGVGTVFTSTEGSSFLARRPELVKEEVERPWRETLAVLQRDELVELVVGAAWRIRGFARTVATDRKANVERRQLNRKGAEAKLRKDPKQTDKAQVCERFYEEDPYSKGRGAIREFSVRMADKYDVSTKSVCTWCAEWKRPSDTRQRVDITQDDTPEILRALGFHRR